MLIQYISDLHLEFYHIQKVRAFANKIPVAADIIVLAGDIGYPHHLNGHYSLFLDIVSLKFKKVFIIAGNHEYYSYFAMDITVEKINTICQKYPNVSFLNNEYEDYLGFRWIGTTLWSKLVDKESNCKINDTKQIPCMTTKIYNKLHQESVEFLVETFKQSDGQKCIVISHHMPSYRLIDKEFLDWDLNQWFASDLDNLLAENSDRISLWIYGHTHKSFEEIPYVCNPMGYPGENKQFNLAKTVDI